MQTENKKKKHIALHDTRQKDICYTKYVKQMHFND